MVAPPDPRSAARAGTDGAPDGAASALAALLAELRGAREDVAALVRVRVERVRLGVREALLALWGSLMALVVVATASALATLALARGALGALRAWTGSAWLSELLLGALVLGGLAAGLGARRRRAGRRALERASAALQRSRGRTPEAAHEPAESAR